MNGYSGIRHESYSDYELDEQPINFLFESLIRKYTPMHNLDQISSDIERDMKTRRLSSAVLSNQYMSSPRKNLNFNSRKKSSVTKSPLDQQNDMYEVVKLMSLIYN